MPVTQRNRIANFIFTICLLLATAGINLTAQAETSSRDQTRFKDIYLSAQLANAAYLSSGEIKTLLSQNGFKLTHQGQLAGYGVGYYLATNPALKQQIIAIRGTSNIENALVDAAFEFVTDDHLKIKLHQGFALSSSQVYAELKPHLNSHYLISTTGHSLGGAVALIVAMHADVDGYKTGQITTFGQPKLTNVSGSYKYRHLDVTRVVMPKDMVPLVPPLDPMSIDPMNLMEMDIYWHQGTELVMQEKNQYSELKGVDSMMRATDFLNEVVSEKNLEQHMMQRYLGALSEKLDNPVKAPYNNDFSLFDLFGR